MASASTDTRIPPADFHHLKELIANREITFPDRLERIARLALDHPDLVAFESSIGLANRCGVSPATVVRFARHLGFKSFQDMRRLFQGRLKELARPLTAH